MALDSAPVQVPDTAQELLEQREDFSDLVDDIQAFMGRYWWVQDDLRLVAALWVIHTWKMPAFYTTPYVYLYGERETGKTTGVGVLGQLAWNAKRADDMTPRVMIERLDRAHGEITLFIDEADRTWRGSATTPIERILNTGYKRGGVVDRMVARDPKEYQTFGPKCLAGIYNGKLPGPLEDRCVPFKLEKKPPEVRLERFIEYRVARSADRLVLCDRIADFVEAHYADIAAQLDILEPVKGLSDRQNEISEPLLAVAAVLGCEERVREALVRLFASREQHPSHERDLFHRIRDAFGDSDRIPTDELCRFLGAPWDCGQPKGGQMLARWLSRFGVSPCDIRFGSHPLKGYERASFDAVFDRFDVSTRPHEPIEDDDGWGDEEE